MNANDVIVYREEQKFAAWLRWLVYLSMGLSVVISVFALQRELSGQNTPETWGILLAATGGIGVPIAVTALFLLLKLE
ncbi:MAG: hypothetical protein ACYS74_08700, partial [Planctomycetota bacterium]